MNNSKIMNDAETIIKQWFLVNQKRITDISDKIWDLAEVKFKEFKSAETLENEFEDEGFKVIKGVANIATAFTAEWSNGDGPTIALIGEFDALPGLGHKISDKKEPTGTSGHGCGHNLLGVGSMSAAFAAKKAMSELGIKGRLKYFGCPAEEGGSAKVFMVRDGVFEGIDAIVRWHPINATYVSMSPALSLVSVKYEFHGKTAHAGTNPHLGRSALDAAILMDVGVNYLREHVVTDVRIHSVITKGGNAPNIVPDLAEIWYYVRAPKKVEVDAVLERINKVAKGMAMATETTVDIKVINGSSDTLPNKVLSERALINLQKVGAPKYTEEERAFAKKLNEGLTTADKAKSLIPYGIRDPKAAEKDLYDEISPNMTEGMISPYSTDSGDVSWQAPMCQMFIAAQTIGTANHSWQQVVCSGMSIGHKGMLCAGQAIAMTAVDILSDPDLLAAAQKEYDEKIALYPYSNPLPKDVVPGAE
ncbi:MAG: amidohydrolase [Clostridiaceae bacterium]|nr:amidohydrolase [Clostridiaceae bacterium]